MKKYLIIIGIVVLTLIILSYIGDISDENEKKRLLDESRQKPTEVVNNDYRQLNPALFISLEDAVADYNYLWQVFEDNYPLFGVSSRLYNVRYEDVKNKYLREIKNKTGLGSFPTNVIWVKDIIQKCFNELKLIGGGLVTPDNYLRFRQFHEDLFSNKRSRQMYEAMGADINGDLILEEYDENDINNILAYGNDVSFKIYSKSEDVGKLAYLELSSSTTYDADRQFEYDYKKIMDFYVQIQDCENLIIDMTKNSCSNLYWIKLLVEPNITEDIDIDYYFSFKNEQENMDYFDLVELDSWTSEADIDLDSLPNINRTDRYMFEKLYKRTVTISPATGEKIFSGNIYLLVDNNSYTDGFAYFCKNTGFAEIVGRQSNNGWWYSLAFGSNLIMLPNSGLIFSYTPYYMMNKDGSSNDEYSIMPDYLCEKGETPFDACVRVIAEKNMEK